VLRRDWATGTGVANFILLNPSTADEDNDDPTIRRCIGFARRLGFGGLVITNIFALRSTDPRALKQTADPVGPDNDQAILREAKEAARVVLGWGIWGAYRKRGEKVRSALEGVGIELYNFGMTSGGQPRHPLYIPNAWNPEPIAKKGGES
jgi:hypothetical protein